MFLSKFQSRKSNIFFLLLTASIVTLPFDIRLNSMAIILLVFFWWLRDGLRDKISNIRPARFFLFAGLYIIHLIGMLYTANFKQGVFELEKKLAMLVFPVVLGTSPRLTKEDVQKVLNYFVASCVVLSFICLASAFYRTIYSGSVTSFNRETGHTLNYFFYDGLSDQFIHPVYFSAYVVFSFFIVMQITVNNWGQHGPAKRIGLVGLLIYLVFFSFLLSARIMLIAFFILLFVYTIHLFYANGRKWLGVSTGFFLMVLLVGIINYVPYLRGRLSELFTSSYEFKNDPEENRYLAGKMDGVEMRLAKWYFTIEAGKATWLQGVGTGDDQDALLNSYKESNFMEGYLPRFNSHNQFLQTWLGLGLIGLLVLLVNLLVPLYISYRSKNLIYMVFLCLIIFFSFTESILCRQHGVVFYALFNSLFAFHTNVSKAD